MFAEPEEVDLKCKIQSVDMSLIVMLPNSERVKRERGSSGDWSRF